MADLQKHKIKFKCLFNNSPLLQIENKCIATKNIPLLNDVLPKWSKFNCVVHANKIWMKKHSINQILNQIVHAVISMSQIKCLLFFSTTEILVFQFVFQAEESSSKDHKRAILGPKSEHEVFNELQKTLENKDVQNTVVINGWKVKDLDRTVTGESDFLIVSLPLEAIIHIEVKRSQEVSQGGGKAGATEKTERDPTIKAAEQLERTKKLLLQNLPFPAAEKWHYIKFIYFEFTDDVEMSRLCPTCKPHILNKGTDFAHWWEETSTALAQEEGSTLDAKNTNTYNNIVKYLLHQMFIQEDVISSG